MKRLAVLLCGSLMIALVTLGLATPPTQRPSTRMPDCTSGGCHAEVTQFRFLHAPVAVDACEVCHVHDDPARHTFRLIERHGDEPICSFCHIGKSTFGRGDGWAGLHVHEPVATGNCLACHNPHGSNMRNLVNADTVSSLCSGCHDGKVGQAHMHPPVGEKECLSCHQPHSGPHRNLLHEPGRDLCLSCHADVLPARTETQSHLPGLRTPGSGLHVGGRMAIWASALLARHVQPVRNDPQTPAVGSTIVHEPLLGACSECHNPHGSPYPGMLQKDVRNLCTSCHADIAVRMNAATVHHSAVLDDRSCLNCHSPHHSPHTALLSDQPIALCAGCHKDSHNRPDGTMIQGMSVLFKGSHLHGPINDGQCSGCHDVHGGMRQSLLTAPYSGELYQPFAEESYALCFTCHDPALAREPRTTTATRFRNGDLNLHYLHVTAPDESGRSCRFCHDTHASAAPRQMRASVSYGQWELPIRFEATDTGGTCGAGCHRERDYTRDLLNAAGPRK